MRPTESSRRTSLAENAEEVAKQLQQQPEETDEQKAKKEEERQKKWQAFHQRSSIRQQRKEKFLEEQRQKRFEKELSQCTFEPATREPNNRPLEKGAGASRCESLYERAQAKEAKKGSAVAENATGAGRQRDGPVHLSSSDSSTTIITVFGKRFCCYTKSRNSTVVSWPSKTVGVFHCFRRHRSTPLA
jgi:hypothetical protein